MKTTIYGSGVDIMHDTRDTRDYQVVNVHLHLDKTPVRLFSMMHDERPDGHQTVSISAESWVDSGKFAVHNTLYLDREVAERLYDVLGELFAREANEDRDEKEQIYVSSE